MNKRRHLVWLLVLLPLELLGESIEVEFRDVDWILLYWLVFFDDD